MDRERNFKLVKHFLKKIKGLHYTYWKYMNFLHAVSGEFLVDT